MLGNLVPFEIFEDIFEFALFDNSYRWELRSPDGFRSRCFMRGVDLPTSTFCPPTRSSCSSERTWRGLSHRPISSCRIRLVSSAFYLDICQRCIFQMWSGSRLLLSHTSLPWWCCRVLDSVFGARLTRSIQFLDRPGYLVLRVSYLYIAHSVESSQPQVLLLFIPRKKEVLPFWGVEREGVLPDARDVLFLGAVVLDVVDVQEWADGDLFDLFGYFTILDR